MQITQNMSWQDRAVLWSQDPVIAPGDQAILKDLLNNKNTENLQILQEMFFKELEFGTAGLRGIVGLGSSRMNIYNIKRATHALALTIKEHFQIGKQRAVISYDSRLSSQEFSLAAAQILSAHQIETYLVDRATATPILSYAVRELKCSAGIMVTASHNPKDYNGYKVYWQDGAQITAPFDKMIMDHYNKITNFSVIPNFDSKIHKKWQTVPSSVYENYYDQLQKSCLRPEMCKNYGRNLKIVYTPLHGTGAEPVKRIFNDLGFTNLHLVPSQEMPDGNFPTTDYPNPEDPAALVLASKLMTQINADVAIGSDPDTDRMGVIINTNEGPRFLSGNEIANFLLYYKLISLKEFDKINADSLVLKSIVTSTFQEALCSKFNVKVINTLTGFKWMAEVLRKHEESKIDFDFVFASEESFGSMPNSFVRDKDGVAAAALLCEALTYFKTNGLSYIDLKKKLTSEIGCFYDLVLNFHFPGMHGQIQMQNLMDMLKNVEVLSTIPAKLVGIEDYQSSTFTDLKTHQSNALKLPKTSMLGLLFDNKSKVYVRPSGTEPKIKFYLLLEGINEEGLTLLATNIQRWIELQIESIKIKEI